MEIFKKHWRLWVFAVFGIFYLIFALTAKSIIEGGVEIGDDGRKEDIEKVRDINVDLIIQNGGTQRFRLAATDNETIGDLLEKLRSQGILTYEFLAYTYGTEISSLNGTRAPGGYRWDVYDGDVRVPDFTRHKLENDGIYTISVGKAL